MATNLFIFSNSISLAHFFLGFMDVFHAYIEMYIL